MNSIDTRFSRNVLAAVQKTRSMCFIWSKTTRLRLVVLNPITHSCSFFKFYLKNARSFIGEMINFIKTVADKLFSIIQELGKNVQNKAVQK